MIFVSVKYKVGSLSEVRLTEIGYGGPGDRLFITTLKGTVISTSLHLQYWRHYTLPFYQVWNVEYEEGEAHEYFEGFWKARWT